MAGGGLPRQPLKLAPVSTIRIRYIMELFYLQLDQLVEAESLIAIVNGQAAIALRKPRAAVRLPIVDDQTSPAS